MFFKLLREALKVKQVRSKILFTIFIVLVFRIGTSITVPGVNANSLNALSGLSFLNMLSLVSGNALKNFSIFALGVSPYITASIVVQLLQMDILPKFVEWGKQGEVGRRKLNQATRYIALVLAFVQSIGITAGFNTLAGAQLIKTALTPQVFLTIGIILTAGSMIVTWLGEQITDKGYGNGVSMIIFAGIVSSIPEMIQGIYVDYFVNVPSSRITSSIIFVIILIITVLLIIYFTTYVQQAEYKIPIQYTKVAQGAPSSSYLPLKVNPAGVIPVIFASSITAAPAAILQFLSATGHDWAWVRVAQEMLATTSPTTSPTGIAMYALLIILFTFFYTFVQINPEKAAESLQKSGAYIHGVRPGKGTEEYMSKLLRRLATVGSLFLGVISILPIAAKDVFGLSDVVAFGGTSLLIIISTGIEGIKQLEGYLLKRKYVGFMDRTE
ncbi:TPA: preprotein translocase subunit SecY [Streptococcus pneumoniae]